VNVAKAFKRENLKTLNFNWWCGRHLAFITAVKIAPESDAPVIYTSDAGKCVTITEQWMNFVREIVS
jgi:5-methyltetrahydrofolate--homocysteine methyltransferase